MLAKVKKLREVGKWFVLFGNKRFVARHVMVYRELC